jgi:hypothetical protein
MSDTPAETAAAWRAEEAAIVRRREEIERPLFARAEELLAQIKPLTDELTNLGPGFVTEYYAAILAMPGESIGRAIHAVAAARPKPAIDFSTPSDSPITAQKVKG